MPDRLYVRLTYFEKLSWTQVSGTLGDNVFRGNSCFDPDLTGTGGQPSGFDQWSAFYASYTVLGSKIEVSCSVNGGTGGPNTNRFGVTPTNFSSIFGASSQEQVEEQPYTVAKNANMGAVGIGNGKITQYMSSAKMVGVVRSAVQNEDAFSALVTANPANQWFWHVWNYVPSGDTQSLFQEIKLTYFVVFETRNQLAPS